MGWGVGFPEGLWFGVRLLFIEWGHMGPFQPAGGTLDFPLGLAAPSSGSSLSLTPGGCLSLSRWGCFVDRSLEGRLLAVLAALDTSVA